MHINRGELKVAVLWDEVISRIPFAERCEIEGLSDNFDATDSIDRNGCTTASYAD